MVAFIIRALVCLMATAGVLTAGVVATVLVLPGLASRAQLGPADAHQAVEMEPSPAAHAHGVDLAHADLAYAETTGTREIMRLADRLPTRYEQTLIADAGDTLSTLLVGVALDVEQVRAAVAAVSDLFGPRDLRPGQLFKLTLESPNNGVEPAARPRLIDVRFAPDAEREITVTRVDDRFQARSAKRTLEMAHAYGSGSIRSNLFSAGRAAGVPRTVLVEMVRALSFDVDFQRDIRRNDRFEVVYESYLDEDGTAVKAGELLFAALRVRGELFELYRFTAKGGSPDFYTPKGKSARRTLLRTPVDGARISSNFGMRKHPILGYSKHHQGVDFAAPAGTPIYAAGDGTVVKAGRNGGYGRYVRLKHTSLYGTAYAHLQRIAKGIKVGAKVKQGQVIGTVGSTGRSTGPHLHYEVLVNGKRVDPRKIKVTEGDRLAGADLKAFRAARNAIDRLRAQSDPAIVARSATPGAPLLR